MRFTDEQLADWRAYEKVRKSGRFNMFDPRARLATRLSADRYSFVVGNFEKLKDADIDAKAENKMNKLCAEKFTGKESRTKP